MHDSSPHRSFGNSALSLLASIRSRIPKEGFELETPLRDMALEPIDFLSTRDDPLVLINSDTTVAASIAE